LPPVLSTIYFLHCFHRCWLLPSTIASPLLASSSVVFIAFSTVSTPRIQCRASTAHLLHYYCRLLPWTCQTTWILLLQDEDTSEEESSVLFYLFKSTSLPTSFLGVLIKGPRNVYRVFTETVSIGFYV
jgi:hypothetical protein